MTRTEIIALIRQEATAAQLSPECMIRIAEIESNLNPNAVNQDSKAAGLYQIMPFHNVPNVLDPLVNTRWAMNYAKQNHEVLRKNNFPVTCFTTYLCHQQGSGGAVLLLKAAREGKRIQDLSAQTQANIGANDGNNSFTTVEQFLRFWERKITNSPVSALPEIVQIPLARFSGTAVAAITATALGLAATYAITRFVEKTTLKEAWEA